MFAGPQFLKSLPYFQQLLQEGVFDLSLSGANAEECRTLKRLVLLNCTNHKWSECYQKIKVTEWSMESVLLDCQIAKNRAWFSYLNFKMDMVSSDWYCTSIAIGCTIEQEERKCKAEQKKSFWSFQIGIPEKAPWEAKWELSRSGSLIFLLNI